MKQKLHKHFFLKEVSEISCGFYYAVRHLM